MAGCRVPELYCPTVSESPDSNTLSPVVSTQPDMLGTMGLNTPLAPPVALKIDSEGMVTDPKIVLERRPNIERGAMSEINGVVVHQTAASTAKSSLSSYSNKGANGAHFLIDKDGTIYQTASLYRQTWHVGKLKARCLEEHTCSPTDLQALGKFNPSREHKREMEKSVPERYPANADSVGIELVGMPGSDNVYETATDEQNASLKWLVAKLLAAFNVAPGEVFRHPVVSRKNQSEAASAKW